MTKRTESDSLTYIRKRSEEVEQLFSETQKKTTAHRFTLKLNFVDQIETETREHTAEALKLEAWKALNNKIVASSQLNSTQNSFSRARTRSSANSQFRKSLTDRAAPDPFLLSTLQYHTAALLDSKRMVLEAEEAIPQTRTKAPKLATFRKRALEASAKHQLKIVRQGSKAIEPLSAKAADSHSKNPFLTTSRSDYGKFLPINETESSIRPGTTRTKGSAESFRGSYTQRPTTSNYHPSEHFKGQYKELFHKYFEHRLQLIEESASALQDDFAMRHSITDLKKCASKSESKLKAGHVQEAVTSFKQEKLVFVYGTEFRGRYISKTHGDLLKPRPSRLVNESH